MSTPSSDELLVTGLLAETRDEIAPAFSLDSPEAEAAREARVGTWIDQYEVLSVLGHGAMGTVFRVRHHRLARDYALKLVVAGAAAAGDNRIQRFLREARASAVLEHPNVIHVVYSGATADGDAYLVMELLEGQSLAALIAQGPLPAERAASIARQLALGLEAIHSAGFVHRDLKPSNVMLVPTPSGEQAKILDLGLVGALEPTAEELRLTQQGHVMGTPQYMAPETFTANEFGARSDLYALGVVLHEMLSGAPPFVGAMKEILWHHCFSPPPRLPGERGLDAVAARLMAKEPAERWGHAREVVEELDRRMGRGAVAELVEDAPARLARDVTRAFAPPTTSRWGRPVGVALLVGAVVGGAAAAAWLAVRARGGGEVVEVAGSGVGGGDRDGVGERVRDRVGEPVGDRAGSGAAGAGTAAELGSIRPGAAEAGRASPDTNPGELLAPVADPLPARPSAPAASTSPAMSPRALDSDPPERPRAARRARVRAEPREVLVTSDPPGARVETAAGILGNTPITVLVAGDRATNLTLHLEGYDDRRVRIGRDARDPALHVRLGASP